MGSISGETIRRAASGDHGAFNEIYRAYEGGLRAYITSHINDKSQAEDVLQNTFVAVFKNIGQLKNPEGLKTWLYKIAYNECMNLNGVTKRETERYTPLSSFADEDGNEREFEDEDIELPEDFATNAELQRLLAKTLNSLPKNQRDCLVLYYYRQKPIAEIAQMLGVSENAVKLRKKSALERLKRKLEKYRKSYNFAFAPMGLLLHKLVGTGKVKSAYTGAAVVRTAGASLAAACTAGVIGIGAIGYFGIKQYNDNKPDQKEDSSISEAVDEDGWTHMNIKSRISSAYFNHGHNGGETFMLIPIGTNVSDYGESLDFDTEPANGFVVGESPDLLLNDFGVAKEEYKEKGYEKNIIPTLLDMSSTDYRFLQLKDMKYKDTQVCMTYEPFLSELDNFFEYDPDFFERKPKLTVNAGLTDEYTVEGSLTVEDGLVIMSFDGVEDPGSYGEHIPYDENMIKYRDLHELNDSDITKEILESGSIWLCKGLFDIKMDGYYTCIKDDAALVSTLYTYSSVPSSPSLYFPGNIDFDKYSFNYNKTSIGHFLQTDSSFTVSGFDSINFLKEHYFLPESNLNNYIRLTAFASNNGYLLQDDILYHDMYDGDSSE